VAERLGRALQKLPQRFESAQRLKKPRLRLGFFILPLVELIVSGAVGSLQFGGMKHLSHAFTCLAFFVWSFGHAQSCDILIQNGKVVDGTGNSWFIADVAIQGGKILSIGNLQNYDARVRIDATGQIVAPGFIDVHAHIEGGERTNPTADNFIYDGVTTVVTGNCGGSSPDMAAYFKRLDSTGMSLNVASLIGHNTVRRAVMGDANRQATAEELAKMKGLVEQAMKDGAVGLSTGLIYVPGTYANTEEIVQLSKEAARFGGVYASHIRDEGDHATEAVSEAINIGRQAKIPVEISHFKVTYRPNWGKSVSTLELVEAARREGIDVTIDQYPYVASSTTLDTTVPTWAFSGGRDSLKFRLANTTLRAKIKMEMLKMLEAKQSNNYAYAVVARFQPDSTYNGKNISQINLLKGRKATAANEVETIFDLVLATNRTQMVYFSMNEEDIERIMKYPFNMIASDAGIVKFGSGVPHPRAYGTNARVLGRYVREKGVTRLEEMIRRMTSLPAQKFDLRDRGLLREGMAADIVIFDEQQVNDQSTYEKPHQYSTGFRYVIVNGQLTISDGKHNDVRAGRALRHVSN
jgi:N-acyl-D-amino-acid deacylase